LPNSRPNTATGVSGMARRGVTTGHRSRRGAHAASCVLGLSILGAWFAAVGGPTGANTVPRGGVIEVTGYGRLSLPDGSQGPVTVVVNGRRAAAIRAALAGLSTGKPLLCMENENAFTISVRPRAGVRPTYVATEENCPTPGVVNITHPGSKSLQTLHEDCALRNAVLVALPPGRADATRNALSTCSS
jgi:hypothetical protein